MTNKLLSLNASCHISSLAGYPPAPKPAGARNALIRGQSLAKYEADFKRGWIGECATHFLLKAHGFEVSDLDTSSTMNKHAPDLMVTVIGQRVPVQVKLASVYGGTYSWVFEKRAAEKLNGYLALVIQEGTKLDYYRVSFHEAEACRSLMKPMRAGHLLSKVALYSEDLGA